MSYFDYSAGHIDAEHNGRKALHTRAPMFNLVPAAAFTLSNKSIVFPDLWKGTLYHQFAQTDPFSGSSNDGCSTWIGFVEQEWGPSEPSPRTLPDEVIGSVPAGTDYLEIWVNLTRTVVPGLMVDLPLGSDFPEGVWVKLDGTSCVVEEFMGVARQFEFVRDGTTIKLRRFQSVNANGGAVSPAIKRAIGGSSMGNKVFFFPGANAPEDFDKYALYGQKIDEKRSRNAATHRPAGYQGGSAWNDPCSMSHAGISYASTWTGTIKITPGFVNAG